MAELTETLLNIGVERSVVDDLVELAPAPAADPLTMATQQQPLLASFFKGSETEPTATASVPTAPAAAAAPAAAPAAAVAPAPTLDLGHMGVVTRGADAEVERALMFLDSFGTFEDF